MRVLFLSTAVFMVLAAIATASPVPAVDKVAVNTPSVSEKAPAVAKNAAQPIAVNYGPSQHDPITTLATPNTSLLRKRRNDGLTYLEVDRLTIGWRAGNTVWDNRIANTLHAVLETRWENGHRLRDGFWEDEYVTGVSGPGGDYIVHALVRVRDGYDIHTRQLADFVRDVAASLTNRLSNIVETIRDRGDNGEQTWGSIQIWTTGLGVQEGRP